MQERPGIDQRARARIRRGDHEPSTLSKSTWPTTRAAATAAPETRDAEDRCARNIASASTPAALSPTSSSPTNNGDVRCSRRPPRPPIRRRRSTTACKLIAEDRPTRRRHRLRLRSVHQRHHGRAQRADPAQGRQDRPDLHRRPRGFDRDPAGPQGGRLPLRPGIPGRARCWCRATCAGVRERVLSDGKVRTPLHEEDVRAACELFRPKASRRSRSRSCGRCSTRRMSSARPRSCARCCRTCSCHRRLRTLSADARIHAHLDGHRQRLSGAGACRATWPRSTPISASSGAKQPVRYFQSNGGLAIGQAMADRRSTPSIPARPRRRRPACIVAAPFGIEQRHHGRHGRHVVRHHADARTA